MFEEVREAYAHLVELSSHKFVNKSVLKKTLSTLKICIADPQQAAEWNNVLLEYNEVRLLMMVFNMYTSLQLTGCFLTAQIFRGFHKR